MIHVDITVPLSAVPSPTQTHYTPSYHQLTSPVSGLSRCTWRKAARGKHRNVAQEVPSWPTGRRLCQPLQNPDKWVILQRGKKVFSSAWRWASWEDLILRAELIPQQTESLETGSLALRRTSFSLFSRCFSSFSWAFFMSLSFFLMVERSLWLETPSAWKKEVSDLKQLQPLTLTL